MTCRLYLITPSDIPDLAAFGRTLAHALDAGDVAALQIRLKGADEKTVAAAIDVLAPICHGRGVALILNDRPDWAAKYGCDGVHIGLEDGSLRDARAIMGPRAMIGVTCADSRHRGMEAAEGGADYVAFGAFYPTQTHQTQYRPDPEILVAAGADFIAVITGVWDYPDGPAAAVRDFNAAIAKAGQGARLALKGSHG
jgi:thiamine-phosphate pyrophosphorylase